MSVLSPPAGWLFGFLSFHYELTAFSFQLFDIAAIASFQLPPLMAIFFIISLSGHIFMKAVER
jgi:hypothetical protein